MTAVVYTTETSTPASFRNVIVISDVPDEGSFDIIHLVENKPRTTLVRNVLHVNLIPDKIHG